MVSSEVPQEDQAVLLMRYFLDNFSLELFSGKQHAVNKEEELASKYVSQVGEVFAVFDRLCRYESYFAKFLPPPESNISEPEAIEYHLRNYVQEFYILRERIHKIVKDLKGDLEYYNIENPEVAISVLDHIATNVNDVFFEINDKLRRGHVHERSLSNYDLTRSKFFASLISGEVPIPDGANIDIEAVKQKYAEIMAPTREKFVAQAVHNSVGLKKLKQFFAARFGHVFASLNGHTDINWDMEAGFD